MNFIILADRYKKGMKSKGPVGLIRLNKKYNVFERQYNVIRKHFPKSKIVYVYGFDAKKVETYFHNKKKKFYNTKIIYNENYENSGYIKSLGVAKEYMNNDFFILSGETVFCTEVFKDFKKKGSSQIFVNQKEKHKLGCVINADQTISNIAFDINNYLMDIYYVHKNNSSALKQYCENEKYKNYFIFEIFNKMIDEGFGFQASVYSKKNISSKIDKKRVSL